MGERRGGGGINRATLCFPGPLRRNPLALEVTCYHRERYSLTGEGLKFYCYGESVWKKTKPSMVERNLLTIRNLPFGFKFTTSRSTIWIRRQQRKLVQQRDEL